MESLLGDWPSYDPHNFTQLRPTHPSNPSNPSTLTPVTYHPTHTRTLPPPDQVICTETKNILIRHFYKHADDKLRPKRAASDHLAPENGSKHMKASTSRTPL